MLLAVSTLLAASPRATANQIRANANSASMPIAASQRSGSAVGPEAERDGDADDDADAQHRLDEAGEHVAGEHGGRAIAIVRKRSTMPAGHVHGDHDGRALHGRGDRHQQDSRRDVVEVAGATVVATGQPALRPSPNCPPKT